MKASHYKYLIIGGGLSGKLMALALASRGIKCAIVDRNPQQHFRDPRTIALNGRTMKILKECNLLDALQPYISDIHDIYVVDDRNDLHMLHFGKEHSAGDAIGHMILSSDFNSQLWKVLESTPEITSITGEYVSVTTDGQKAVVTLQDNTQLSSSLLIAADGMKSSIAQQFFTKCTSKQYDQAALTFLINHDRPHQNMAMEHFMPSGPFATLPLRDPHQSSIVWCDNLSALQYYTSLPSAELSMHLQERIGPVLGKVKPMNSLSEKHCFPLSANITDRYYHKNIVLIADAAHNVHPLAGQGLNQGVKDIESLAMIIDDIEYCGLEISYTMLKRYERERALDNYLMYQLTDKLSLLFSNNIPLVKLLRRTGLSLLDGVGPLKGFMRKYASGN